MEFLEDLFEIGERKRRKRGGFYQNKDHHGHENDNDHYDDHDEDHDDDRDHEREKVHDHNRDHDQNHQSTTSPYSQTPINPASFLTGVVCRYCSTQTIQGAEFCHGCGVIIEIIQNCGSCGSRLPANAPCCPQCGAPNRFSHNSQYE